jgi:hypothetical protein
MDLMQAAHAAQAATESAGIDWQTVGVAAAGTLVIVCGWVWTSTVKWLGQISNDFRSHVQDDNKAFAEVKQMINDTHIETLRAIAGQHNGRRED